MHNLFLGTAKRMFQLWLEEEILTKRNLKIVEERIKEMEVGTGLGRLPHKISSNHGHYKASQWKHWTTIYSTYVLDGLLPNIHLNCWNTFVMACRFLAVPILTSTNLMKADILLLKFCREFEKLYGNRAVRVNMHLHCHLKDCIEDYGSIYSFWCFAFERYNGILGTTKTNNRSVEIQIMRKFLSSRFVWNVSLPEEFSDSMLSFFNSYKKQTQTMPAVETVTVCSPALLRISVCTILSNIKWSDTDQVILPLSYKLMQFDQDDRHLLCQTYQRMYPEKYLNANMVSETARRYQRVTLAGEKFGSKLESRSLRCARVMASWVGDDGEVDPTAPIRPGEVKFYFTNCLSTDDDVKQQHIFACIQWYSEDAQNNTFRRPVELWQSNIFDSPGPATFLPIQRVYCKFAAAYIQKSESRKLVVTPILRTFC